MLVSWRKTEPQTPFSIKNIPFGMGEIKGKNPVVVTRIADEVIDLDALHQLGYFESIRLPEGIFNSQTLNPFIALGKEITGKVRNRIIDLLSDRNEELKKESAHHSRVFFPVSDVTMVMPVEVGDYTDFYSSIQHATNVGKMFRDPENALLPNWKHLPVGYHGRSGTIFCSGHSFHRPQGQMKPPDAEKPVFGPTRLLDFELEMAFVVGKNTQPGQSVSVNEAPEYIFGMVLFNDWSARDIQAWEYVPLGPFLGKNFASTISPWVVTMDALEPFRVSGPVQDPEVLPYLKGNLRNINIDLEVFIRPKDDVEYRVCASNFKYMYWTMEQQLAHHTVNGCMIRVGDMMASGTISGENPDSFGSMLELTWRGSRPLKLGDHERKFINDFDEVILRGYAGGKESGVGFGEAVALVLPAK